MFWKKLVTHPYLLRPFPILRAAPCFCAQGTSLLCTKYRCSYRKNHIISLNPNAPQDDPLRVLVSGYRVHWRSTYRVDHQNRILGEYRAASAQVGLEPSPYGPSSFPQHPKPRPASIPTNTTASVIKPLGPWPCLTKLTDWTLPLPDLSAGSAGEFTKCTFRLIFARYSGHTDMTPAWYQYNTCMIPAWYPPDTLMILRRSSCRMDMDKRVWAPEEVQSVALFRKLSALKPALRAATAHCTQILVEYLHSPDSSSTLLDYTLCREAAPSKALIFAPCFAIQPQLIC
jgi:hypothetical protein